MGVLALACAAAAQQPNVDRVVDAAFAVVQPGQAAIAPDGARVAWVQPMRPGRGSGIFVTTVPPAPGLAPRRITAGTGSHSEDEIAWAPDGRQLAFLSDAPSPGQDQVFVADVTSGAARQLTHVTGYLSDLKWSSDGKTLAFLFIENAPRAAGPLVAMTRAVGIIEEKTFEQRIALADLAGGEVRQISPADFYIYEYDWAPDSKAFVVSAAKGAGDPNWWFAQLYTLGVAGGEMKSILKPPLQIAEPHWSADGKSVAYIGGIMSDEGSTGGDVFVVPASGGEAKNLTPGMKASASWLEFLPSGQIVFTAIEDGQSGLYKLDPNGGTPQRLWIGPEVIHAEGWGVSASVARDGVTSAVVRSSFERPPELWVGPVGQWKQVTHLNAQLQPQWGKAENLHWDSGDLRVEGWLLYPRNFDPSRKYPLVVTVHGGPAAACMPRWPGYPFEAPLASQGYFVLCPNPRGSYGMGEQYTQGNVKDFGYGDFRDIVAGVDAVLKLAPVDEKRIGITGWSYGGYMTMWAVTQTRRFAAAVAGAGLSNWLSYYGENDIDGWMLPYFGASVYDDPQVYQRSAPITFIKQAKTPTLVLVGERDGEVPAPQSFEFWHALKTFNVPTQLVVYPDEGHGIREPEHQHDIVHRMLDWFARYMPESSK